VTDLAPLDFSDFREWLRKTVAAVNAALNGANRTTGEVTLTANDTTTTVTTPYVTEESAVIFTPLTANAATEVGEGGMYVSTRTNGVSFVITHANGAETDRDFAWALTNK
jgi:hypothetical protein